MKKKGHEIFVAAREKEITYYLLEKYKISFQKISTHQTTLPGKIYDFFIRWKRTYNLCKELKPNIAMGVGDFYLAQIGRTLNFPSLVFTDTDHVKHDLILTFPFATNTLTPTCFRRDLGRKQIRYNGCHELAYLHPKYFKPDPSILDLLGVKMNEKYIIMRFVSWAASHDVGHRGLSLEMKKNVVKKCSEYAKVSITSEAPLPKDLEKYRIGIPPEKIHDALYYASMYIGEGATMASECAVLGTPAIYTNDLHMGYTNEEEKKYGLIFQSVDQMQILNKIKEWLGNKYLREKWKKRCELLIYEKIDVTAFMVWFMDNYPESSKIMKDNPAYQWNFK